MAADAYRSNLGAKSFFGRPAWCSSQLTASKDNRFLHRTKRSYFDGIPAKIQNRGGEFADVFVLQPNEVGDVLARGWAPRGRWGQGVLPQVRSRPQSARPGSAQPYCVWPERPSPAQPASARRWQGKAPTFYDGQLLPGTWTYVREPTGRPGSATGQETARASGAAPAGKADVDSAPPRRDSAPPRRDSCEEGGGKADGAGAKPKAKAAAARGERKPKGQETLSPVPPQTDVTPLAEFQRFKSWCEAKRWTLMTCWRRLDKDGSMSLHKKEFVTGLKESLKYDGDLEKLWQHIDSDHTGIVSFTEFCPEEALALASFKHWSIKTFGSLTALFRAFDSDKSGTVSMKEFSKAAHSREDFPLHLSDTVKTLFLLLDTDEIHGKGSIDEDELKKLENWNAPAFLWEDANQQAKDRLKAALFRRFNDNALLAWRKVLDKDASMRVSYNEFDITCKSLARAGVAEANPPQGVASMYVAIDGDRSGWFSLRSWDEDAHQAVCSFLKMAKDKSGKVTDFIRSMAHGDDQMVNWATYRNHLRGGPVSNLALSTVFEGLGISKPGYLTAADVAFLDKWDPEREEAEQVAWRQLAAKHLGM